MTADWESAALRWLEAHLRGHHCPRCGREWVTKRSTAVLMHQCIPTTQPYDWRPAPQRHDDERREWARDKLGAIAEGLEAAVPEEEQLRRVDDE